MGYQVLARKYRPQRFADVAGQDHVTRTLMNALSQNRVAHGYIFSGHRGIGKTTIARILAMALNCRTEVGSAERPTMEPCLQCISCREISSGGSPEAGNEAMHSFDFIEIDAASNRGIDDVRSIRNEATVQPARDRYKIFLLDEAHQITDAAFNAILKTLEEPPEWSIFMMATTQPEDIPQTIRSRCQHFSFHAVKFDDILAQLKMIAGQENVAAEDAALALLAEAGDGSMRDALSIMDQAIASAPLEDGKAVLSAAQIRELMGSVPNAVFERLLEAVAAGQSAELMEQLNLLLNAGHNPSSLARQMVRYLRNALMAKLGGEQTDLLQISRDERARAARTALLFTEEDLTRNLQIVLRTFDDLNYRQEQRFHLELGLLKLIHAQRLLPIEELLSGVSGGTGTLAATRSSAPASNPRTTPSNVPRTAPAQSSLPPAPSISPFGQGGGWSSGPKMESAPKLSAAPAPAPEAATKPAVPAASAVATATPFPAAASPATGFASTESLTEGALAKAPQAAQDVPSVDTLRQATCSALAAAGHPSAAQLLGAGNWILDGATLRIEVAGMGKKMLALTVNAAAEKIIRQELQRHGAPARFLVVPCQGGPASAQVMAAPAAGSIQEAALEHPLVQRAKEIFNAEVRSVVDLRIK
ncbi:MAG TPA: DNA polymerase III subunit gamma/tau [Terracidiphilus sp.]|nr:DNA polymerase III subunit gamma/tau [Terracidiphilus sp.]